MSLFIFSPIIKVILKNGSLQCTHYKNNKMVAYWQTIAFNWVFFCVANFIHMSAVLLLLDIDIYVLWDVQQEYVSLCPADSYVRI